MKYSLDINDWICIEGDENDYVIERFEVRIKGKKPLILNKPSFSKLVFVTQQYLNLPLNNTKTFLKETVLDSPEPMMLVEYIRLIEYLESN
ncbi:hypothetical protein C1N32_05530 [Vibrio diazotrophicus]|uniref:Uncharacterized protein n=1 Tax=Vibrio diazotrophicus TaxID=685 RepID=A0A2J8I4U8_VIBDI|nr:MULTISPECIES: hypothetical protein [Vibrio]MCF7361894.1 hypothetical protein [Vibrio sp. A1-b2]PNI05562.1 hypothetical protein C1N32_05530 [Vibrio diazotrophicus]